MGPIVEVFQKNVNHAEAWYAESHLDETMAEISRTLTACGAFKMAKEAGLDYFSCEKIARRAQAAANL